MCIPRYNRRYNQRYSQRYNQMCNLRYNQRHDQRYSQRYIQPKVWYNRTCPKRHLKRTTAVRQQKREGGRTYGVNRKGRECATAAYRKWRDGGKAGGK